MSNSLSIQKLSSTPDKSAGEQSVYFILIMLGLVNLFNYMDRIVFSMLLELIKDELSLSDSQMGLLGGFAFAAFYAIFGLFMGWMADRYNRVNIISVSLAVWSAASAACGIVHSFAQLFFARICIGAGEAGCVPSGHSIIGDCFPPERRSLAIAIFTGLGFIGTLMGMSLSGILVEWVGWRGVFICFGLPGLLFAIVVRLSLKEPGRGQFDTVSPALASPRFIASVKQLIGYSAFRHLLIAISLYYCIAGAWVWVPSYFFRSYAVSVTEFGTSGGLLLGIGSIIGIVMGGFFVNKLIGMDARWEFWFPALAIVLSVPLHIALYSVDSITSAYLLLFLSSAVFALGMGPSMACVQVLAPPSIRATAVALMIFTTSLIGYGMMPLLIGILSDVFVSDAGFSQSESLRWALIATLILPLWSALHFVIANRVAANKNDNT